MNYHENLITQKEVTSEKDNKRRILYVTSIGADADKCLNQMFRALYLHNPRCKKSKLGNMNVMKYSFEFYDESVVENICTELRQTWYHEYKDKCKFLKESKNSVFLVNQIEFY